MATSYKIVKMWDNIWRVALLKQASKYDYFITFETPIKVRKVKQNAIKYAPIKHNKGKGLLKEALLNRGNAFGITEAAKSIIRAA